MKLRRIAIFCVVFVALSMASYTRTSAVWDEPVHLVAGSAALINHDYRFDPEHPPLLRMWAALPMAMTGAAPFDVSMIERIAPAVWARELHIYASNLLYDGRDADHLLYQSRFMIVLLGCALGAVVFLWALEWAGAVPATVALALLALEPNLSAHFGLVTTDAGFTLLAFAATYALWRTVRQWSWPHVAQTCVLFALAVIAKFTAVLLCGSMLLLIVASAAARRLTLGRALGLIALLGASAFAAIWAIYGFRYAPSADPAWLFAFHRDPEIVRLVPGLSSLVGWIDAHHLLPNAFSEGFLIGQSKAVDRPAYLLGTIAPGGWWYFFPVAILVKTPIAILALAIAGAAFAISRFRADALSAAFVVLPIVVFLGAAMTTHINIGLRHVLPIYPFLMLLTAGAIRWVMTWKPALVRAVITLAIVGTAAESARAYPDTLAFFNTAAGGPDGGSAYLVDSSLDWGQDLKPLKSWMDAHGVSYINLAYFGTAKPAYYGIQATEMPGSAYYAGRGEMRLPGYVAVSQTILRGVYLTPSERRLYATFANRVPVDNVGHSISIFWVEGRWW